MKEHEINSIYLRLILGGVNCELLFIECLMTSVSSMWKCSLFLSSGSQLHRCHCQSWQWGIPLTVQSRGSVSHPEPQCMGPSWLDSVSLCRLFYLRCSLQAFDDELEGSHSVEPLCKFLGIQVEAQLVLWFCCIMIRSSSRPGTL